MIEKDRVKHTEKENAILSSPLPSFLSLTQPLNVNGFHAPPSPPPIRTHIYPSPWTLAHCLRQCFYSFKLNYLLAFCGVRGWKFCSLAVEVVTHSSSVHSLNLASEGVGGGFFGVVYIVWSVCVCVCGVRGGSDRKKIRGSPENEASTSVCTSEVILVPQCARARMCTR